MANANLSIDPLPGEQWKPVPGWEGYYSVSDHGRVRSHARMVPNGNSHIPVHDRILRAGTRRSGHKYVSLCRDGGATVLDVHRLVMLAFIGPCPDGMECLHWDDNPENNVPSNLRYGTRSDNQYDKVRNKRHHQTKKTHCPRGHQLHGANLVPSQLKLGYRDCLACKRARDRLKYHPHLKPQFVEIANSYHADIMRDAA